MTIIRNRADVPNATTADLLETYNAMTGKDIKKFSSRGAAESQTSNAIMAAEDAAGKLGIKKGSRPVAMTHAELQEARAAKEAEKEIGQGTSKSAISATAAALLGQPPATKGSLRQKLAGKAAGEPNKPREKPARPMKKPGAGRAPKVEYVTLTGAGRSKMQLGSIRRSVFDTITGLAAKAKNGVVSVEDLQEKFQETVRGHVLKLIFEGHVIATDANGKAIQ